MNEIKQYDVVGLGACGVDLYINVPILPSAGDKVSAESFSFSSGGVTANNIIQAARLGLKTAWVGALGNDDWAQQLEKEFEDNQVKSFTVEENSLSQQFYILQNQNRDTMMIGLPGATKMLSVEQVEEKLSAFIDKAKHFHTEVAMIPLAAALKGAQIAKEHNIRILIDIDGDPNYLIEKEKIGTQQELKELISLSDVLKLSTVGANSLLNNGKIDEQNIKKLLGLGPKIVSITLGEKGCLLSDKNNVVKIESFRVDVKDSAGAGDAFMGGLSYGLLQNWPLEKVGRFANACGAFKCTKEGTRSSGTKEEIEKFMKNY